MFQSSVSSFATRRKLLCSHLSGRYKIPGISERTQGWALSRRYLYGDKIFGNLKYELRQRLSGFCAEDWRMRGSLLTSRGRSSSKIQKQTCDTLFKDVFY